MGGEEWPRRKPRKGGLKEQRKPTTENLRTKNNHPQPSSRLFSIVRKHRRCKLVFFEGWLGRGSGGEQQ